MKFGIDALSFYTSNYCLDMGVFAKARGQDPSKFFDDFGQNKMSVIPPNEDVVTLALNATDRILNEDNISDIEMVIFATESGFDLSKAAATYIHELFNLPSRCRVIELKQACYSGTFGLQMGISWLRQNTDKKVLLIASDIARYGLNTVPESSQGCGAVAMLLSGNPKLLEIESEAGFCTKETMDFWRPDYLDVALVDGRLSCDAYIRFAKETWNQYAKLTGRKFSDHDRFCYHVPLAKLVESTHKNLARINKVKLTEDQLEYHLGKSLLYNREVGNCYSASLYLSLLSLLENEPSDLSEKLIGLYSYGSGSSGEFFATRPISGYKDHLYKEEHLKMFSSRKELPFSDYINFHNFKIPVGDDLFEFPEFGGGKYFLKSFRKHQRVYGMKE